MEYRHPCLGLADNADRLNVRIGVVVKVKSGRFLIPLKPALPVEGNMALVIEHNDYFTRLII